MAVGLNPVPDFRQEDDRLPDPAFVAFHRVLLSAGLYPRVKEVARPAGEVGRLRRCRDGVVGVWPPCGEAPMGRNSNFPPPNGGPAERRTARAAGPRRRPHSSMTTRKPTWWTDQ